MSRREMPRRPRQRRAWLIVGAAGTAALIGLAIAGGPGFTQSDAARTADLARGTEIYAEACTACHGVCLEGQPDWRASGADGLLPAPPHDETGHTWHHPDRVLLDIMRVGTAEVGGGGYESNMPAFGDTYSDEELRDVLEWIKSQWPARPRAFQSQVTVQDAADV